MKTEGFRIDGRNEKQLRAVRLTPDFTKYAEGCVLIEMGDTRVLCTATVEDSVPPHVKGSGAGWVTAEYSMLPRATTERNKRDISKMKIAPRSSEIQRLIGRALRACVDLSLLGERSIIVDCDVLQADGGTRTASITGGFLALSMAVKRLYEAGKLTEMPIKQYVAAISVGVVNHIPLLDLCYEEDRKAEVDMNVVMDDRGNFIEVQGTGENGTFDMKTFDAMLSLAKDGVKKIIKMQKKLVDITDLKAPEIYVIASHNQGKIREIDELLRKYGIRGVSQSEVNCDREPEETGKTFEENALIKARAICAATNCPAIADDSGLEVMALNCEPGIYSARYAGENATDQERIEKLLKNMQHLDISKRGARFVSALALAMPDKREFVVRGECYGIITDQPHGDAGFGYDPVFFDPNYQKTFGELDSEIKNAISHRANAMKLFAQKLPDFLAKK